MAQGLSASALGGRCTHYLANKACFLTLSLSLSLCPVLECMKAHSPLNPLVSSDMGTHLEKALISFEILELGQI